MKKIIIYIIDAHVISNLIWALTCFGYSVTKNGNKLIVDITKEDIREVKLDNKIKDYEITFKYTEWFLTENKFSEKQIMKLMKFIIIGLVYQGYTVYHSGMDARGVCFKLPADDLE